MSLSLKVKAECSSTSA